MLSSTVVAVIVLNSPTVTVAVLVLSSTVVAVIVFKLYNSSNNTI